MTLWNPLNVFSGTQKRAGDDPSASFDPSRTGDPLPAGQDRPAIGFGVTRVGNPAGYGDPPRNPIGFAPAEDAVTEPRYLTELSFKRHHELPRATTTSDVPEQGEMHPWQTPQAMSDETIDSEPDFFELDAPALEVAAVAPGAEKVPFFKREISFRRKRATDGDPATEVADDEQSTDLAAAADEDYGIRGYDEEREAAVTDDDSVSDDADDPFEVEILAVEEPMTEDQASDASGEVLAEEAPGAELDEEPELEAPADPDAEKVPFYKRELSFRRKRTADDAPATEAADEDEDAYVAAAAGDDRGPHEDDDATEGVIDESDELAVGVFALEDADVTEDPAHEAVDDEAELADADDAQAAGSSEAEPAHEPAVEELVGATVFATAEEKSALDDDLTLSIEDDEAWTPIPANDEPVVLDDPVGEPAADPFDQLGWPTDDAFDVDDDVTEPTGGLRSRSGKRKDKENAPKRKQARSGKGRRVVGLKIGASQIAAAVVTETDGGHELLELARRPLASGIVVDGEVRDVDALSNAVKAFFDEENLPKKDIRIGLASNRIGVRTFDIVGILDEERFDNAVRFKAHEVLPVAVHESVLDYRVLEEKSNDAGEPTRRVLLVVAPRDQVEPYVEVARRAGIKLSGIDLEALGLLRTFVDPQQFAVRAIDDTATVVVAIGHESSTLLVAGGGACEFTRVFDWGGGALEEAIAAALEVHPAEAATILKHLSLSGPGRQFDGLDEERRAKALDAVRLRLTPFARELVSSLQFYQTQDGSLGIGGIVITGGTSHLEGLGDALHQMIGVNVSVGDPFARVVAHGDFDPAIEAMIGSMAVPIGLAISDVAMREVNLLPKDAVRTRSTRSTLTAIGVPVAIAVPLVALGFLYLGAHGSVSDKQSQLDGVQAEIAALPQPTGPTIDPSIAGDEVTRATAIASVLGGRVSWDAVFSDLARVLPANVWLKALSVKEPEAGVLADGTTAPPAVAGQAQPAPTGVLIDGYTYTQPDVARLLARLATLPSLQRVTLTSSVKEKLGKNDVFHFIIVADLSSAGGAS